MLYSPILLVILLITGVFASQRRQASILGPDPQSESESELNDLEKRPVVIVNVFLHPILAYEESEGHGSYQKPTGQLPPRQRSDGSSRSIDGNILFQVARNNPYIPPVEYPPYYPLPLPYYHQPPSFPLPYQMSLLPVQVPLTGTSTEWNVKDLDDNTIEKSKVQINKEIIKYRANLNKSLIPLEHNRTLFKNRNSSTKSSKTYDVLSANSKDDRSPDNFGRYLLLNKKNASRVNVIPWRPRRPSRIFS